MDAIGWTKGGKLKWYFGNKGAEKGSYERKKNMHMCNVNDKEVRDERESGNTTIGLLEIGRASCRERV